MRIVCGSLLGVTAMMLAWILWKPALAWTFTHNAPSTHPDCQPKYRTCHDGIWTEGPWT